MANGNGTNGNRAWSWWRDNWQAILFTTSLVWGTFLATWPTIRVKADIGSQAEIDSLELRAIAVEARMLSSERNQAITTVMIAELTGRVGHGEAQALIIEIAQGKVDQAALMRLLLTPPKEDDR